MEVIIQKLKPPYPDCEECSRKARFRILIKYGQGNRIREELLVCTTHLKQQVLIAEKLVESFKKFKKFTIK